mgnify:CR=1 FL=1
MINNQFSRRNLSIETRLALAYKFKEFEVEKAKIRKLATLKQFSEQEETEGAEEFTDSLLVGQREEVLNKPSDTRGKTLEIIAQKAGVSRATAEQYDAIQRKGTKEQKQTVSSGEASIKKVYTQIQKAERLEKNKTAQWPTGKYRIIYADPPWQYGNRRLQGFLSH